MRGKYLRKLGGFILAALMLPGVVMLSSGTAQAQRRVVIVPMVLMSLNRGLRGDFERHKRISRWTWPLWMYVSVTGVIIYLLLYQIFPQRGH